MVKSICEIYKQLSWLICFLESDTLDLVRVTGVRNTSFQVNYTAIANATYLIRVYKGTSLSIQTTTNLTNVTFELADPTRNTYMVEVAYMINGIQSSFSPGISTSEFLTKVYITLY